VVGDSKCRSDVVMVLCVWFLFVIAICYICWCKCKFSNLHSKLDVANVVGR